ncbi:hypothetical protein Q7C36_010563 [Tachysurus vachellii]|uniref:Uncharacterized protein n=1 Tax=Tachysurus vachellii TaxID=175792 RepID=A0AA88MZB8_TACVA|nr:hypothetical protein Q7C36_010563 [Tachysurus vachellii]
MMTTTTTTENNKKKKKKKKKQKKKKKKKKKKKREEKETETETWRGLLLFGKDQVFIVSSAWVARLAPNVAIPSSL